MRSTSLRQDAIFAMIISSMMMMTPVYRYTCAAALTSTMFPFVSSSTSPIKTSSSSLFSTKNENVHDAVQELNKLELFYNNNNANRKNTAEAPTIWKSKEEASNFVDNNIDTVMFDCDGVLYQTSNAIPGASECIKGLLNKGKKVLFVTNNAGVNRRELKEKLSKLLNISDDLSSDMMVSSSYSCAQYLKQHLLVPSPSSSTPTPISKPRVHVIGSSGLCEEIANTGFEVSGGPCSTLPASMDRNELANYNFDEQSIDAIAVGHDTEFTFRKLAIANNLLLRNPKALFVATNEDSFDLVLGNDGSSADVESNILHIPGNGCVVKALEHCSRRKAINVGKPNKYLADLIFSNINNSDVPVDPSRCLFVGDRLDTDIRFGNENGMKSLLVMTGVTTAQKMIDLQATQGTEEEPLPQYILPHVGMLFS